MLLRSHRRLLGQAAPGDSWPETAIEPGAVLLGARRAEVPDAGDAAAMDKVFAEDKPEAVIHFAGFKAVGESVENPIKYYQ